MRRSTEFECPYCNSTDIGHRSAVTVECIECGAIATHSGFNPEFKEWDWTDGETRRRADRAFDDARSKDLD